MVEELLAAGRNKLEKGRLQEALADFYSAIRLDRKSQRAYEFVAEAALASGQFDACLNYASYALELGSASARAVAVRQECASTLDKKRR